MIAISTDSPALTGLTKQNLNITYLLLSDENKEAIDAYNVIDTGNTSIARPATYIIDQDGRVAWKSLDMQFGNRTVSEQIIAELKKL